MKFSSTVADIADMSPTCSIIVAIAIGAITRIAVTSNLHIWNLGRPTQPDDVTEAKLMIAEPSGLVTPNALRIRAKTYEITTPISIGIILNIPLPHMLNTMITARATMARSQLVEALEIADDANDKPMQIMIGPVTTGGRNFITLLTPTNLKISATTKYRNPATTTPPQAYAALSLTDIFW